MNDAEIDDVAERTPEVACMIPFDRPENVIVPDDVNPVRDESVPVIVEFPVTPIPPDETVSVVRVGEVPNTNAPLPVSFVIAVARFADDGVPRNVAIPVPNPLTPVEIGSPVAFVSVADDGVPRAGVTKVGEFENTSAPLPVSSPTIAASSADVSINPL